MTEKAYLTILLRAVLFLSTIFIIQFYFAKRLRNSLIEIYSFDKRKLTRLIIILIVYFNLFPVFSALAGIYSFINPETEFEVPKLFFIDYFLRIPSWYVIILIVQVFILTAPLDLILYFLRKFSINVSKFISFYFSKYFVYLTIFFIVYIPLRSYYEYKNVSVEKRVYEIQTEKNDLNNFKIAFISDVQADRFNPPNRVQNYFNKLNSLNPDLVLAGGDFISGESSFIPIITSLVKNINSNFGIYSCVGDHDFTAFKKQYYRSLDSVKKALKTSNVNMIDNGNLFLIVNESKIKVTFLSNTYIKAYDESVFDSLAQMGKNADLKILVTHQPDENIALKAKEHKYHLYLCGHTHGGQVNFIFPFIKATPVWLETKFISGDFQFNGMLMIVNRGLGMSTMPIRYHSIPEISLIEIKVKNFQQH